MARIVGLIFKELKEEDTISEESTRTIEDIIEEANNNGLDNLKVEDLKLIAKNEELEFKANIKKDELIELIESNMTEEGE
ncbi:MAG: hypothetical protein ACRCVJ_12395 [Clostridium sp.]|uniref:hypothetical protein n=1 Tax=Clostridium sp. TaxID=1506 RepID=UPI003F340AB7